MVEIVKGRGPRTRVVALSRDPVFKVLDYHCHLAGFPSLPTLRT